MKITVNNQFFNYDIVMEKGLLNNLSAYLTYSSKNLVITDDLVPKSLITKVTSQIPNVIIYTFPSGEQSKNLNTVENIYQVLLDNNFDRKSLVISLGGGISGDLAGYVAATFKRGTRFVNIPSTTLAMIDSSIGGKVGVNFNNVKNMIGTFYNPEKVLIDIDVLNTLPKRHFYNGIIEGLKMGLCLNKELYDLIKEDPFKNIEKIIYESVLTKLDIVKKDPFEKDLRMVLNFGHTLGHAIESLQMGSLLHGECVGTAMPLMIKNKELKEEVKKLILSFNINYEINNDIKQLIDLIKNDKKIKNNYLTLVILNNLLDFEFKKVKVTEIDEFFRKEII